jgi:ferredoxin
MARHAHRTDRANRTHRLEVDWTACQGHGLCAELLPEHLTLDEWGYPLLGEVLLPPTTLKHARGAAADCPVLALKLATARGS